MIMERAKVLQPLSRQHKTMLMTCLLIRKGLQKNSPVQVMVNFFLESWKADMLPHFEQEEKILVPLLNKFTAGKTYAAAILRDHELLNSAVEHLHQEAHQGRLLKAIAEQLNQHIRYEERIVFQEMTAFVPTLDLQQLVFQEQLHTAVCSSYPNHFWE
jgi:iron-sulfur cluster repair protein YtfE (RIC family)